MSSASLSTLVQYFRRSAERDGVHALPDEQLLSRWLQNHDEAAFELLLWRHAPMLVGLCQRMLSNPQDVEDAFQATILTLLRKANAIGKRDSVGSWLYKVAYRVALRLRATARTRADREAIGTDVSTLAAPLEANSELGMVLDEEINRLPSKYRVPVVLCYLQGKTNEATARELHCPVGTIYSRLATARKRLQICLKRRGIQVGAIALSAILEQSQTSHVMATGLVNCSVKLALSVAAGRPAGEVVSSQVLTLTRGALQSLWLSRVKLAAAFVLGIGLIGTSTGALLCHAPAEEPSPQVKRQPAQQKEKSLQISSQIEGILLVIGTELKPDEKVANELLVSVKVDGQTKEYRRLVEGDMVEKGQLVAQLDDRTARLDATLKKAQRAAAEAELLAANKEQDVAKHRRDYMEKLHTLNAVAQSELEAAKAKVEQLKSNLSSKQASVLVAQLKSDQAELILARTEIRSPGRGTISKIYKKQGEGVTPNEPIICIDSGEKPVTVAPKQVSPSGSDHDVPSPASGKLMLIGSEIKNGENVRAGEYVAATYQGILKRYHRLKEGDAVRAGELIGIVDGANTSDEIVKKNLAAAQSNLKASEDKRNAALSQLETLKKQISKGLDISREEYESFRLRSESSERDVDAKKKLLRVAELELEQAALLLSSREIHSPCKGVIKLIFKRSGEAVKVLEPVVVIQEFTR